MQAPQQRQRRLLRTGVVSFTLAVGCFGSLMLAGRRSALLDEWTTRVLGHEGHGDWEKTARSAREALRIKRDDPDALRWLARSSVHLGHDDTAIRIYNRRLGADAMQAEDYLLLGVAQRRRGHDEQALMNWNRALETDPITPATLDQLSQLFYEQGSGSGSAEYVRNHPFDQATRAAERLARYSGWELRADMTLGLIRYASDDVTGAVTAFRRVLARDPDVAARTQEPTILRKLLARLFLKVGCPDEARPHLQAISGRQADPETSWLMSRVHLQAGLIAEARDALGQADAYRAMNPLEPEPSPYVGESRCASCHAAIAKESIASRHTQTYYRRDELRTLPRPDRPLADPTDPTVTHALREVDGALVEETRVGEVVLASVVQYAFGTRDRYLTMVLRDGNGLSRNMRHSYYSTSEGRGWDRTSLDVIEPDSAEGFQGQAISVRAGVVRCLYCHTTVARAGRERAGPETADRAIGCERCHGPGANHLAAIAAGGPDLAIVNPASASPASATAKLCNDCHILDRNYVNGDREDPYWVRSQGAGWAWSRCNTESDGAFGCVTCHDPHQGARALTTAQYEAKCLSCHSETAGRAPAAIGPPRRAMTKPASRACPVDPTKGCIACHMPSVPFKSSHLNLTDHFIRIRRPPASQGSGTISKAASLESLRPTSQGRARPTREPLVPR